MRPAKVIVVNQQMPEPRSDAPVQLIVGQVF
jgi:hypothetical protein